MARKSRAKRLATIDCETDPFLHRRVPVPFYWDIFDGEKHYGFEHTSDALHFLMDKPWIVYAHNGGKFDYLMPGFLDGLEAGDKLLVINGRLAKFKMGLCEFRDSINILPIALRDYQKEEIDYWKMERKIRKAYLPEIIRYCEKDTEYLYDIVRQFRETYGDGITLAGSAMKFWSAFCNVDLPQSKKSFYDQIAPHYYGGRCECFHVGRINNPFRMADINSAYPYAMLHNHPFSTIPQYRSARVSDPIIPQSMYKILATSHGAFPYRENDGSLAFPHARRIYSVTGWEVQAALDTGTVEIEKIIERIDFDTQIDFKKYIGHFYEMKKNSAKKSAEYIFSKLMMNSLYGKLAANPSEYANYSLVGQDEVIASGGDYVGDLGKLSIVAHDLEEHEMRFYNVATGASITGFVRAFLWRHLCAVKKAGGEILYCDTDSIAYAGKCDAFAFSKELGDWSDEGEFAGGGIGGKKLYAFQEKASGDWKVSCKGVDLTPDEILAICDGSEVVYKRNAPSLSMNRRITGDAKLDKKRLFLSRKTRLTGKVQGVD